MIKAGNIVAAAATLVLLAPLTAGAAPSSYTDPTGDNGSSADIGTVTVDTSTDGFLVVKPVVANLPALGQTGFVVVVLDTDRNGSTGALVGGDYAVVFATADASFGMLRWSGSEYVEHTGDVQAVVGSGSIELRVRPAAIGGATTFNFVVFAQSAVEDEIDAAPDVGTWFYEQPKPPPPPVTAESVEATFVPAAPRAGRTFRPSAVRLALSDGRTIRASKYRCAARLGGRTIRGTGKGGCTFALPRNAKGKRLRVTLFAAHAGGAEKVKPYVFKVR
jgi:hypothetical protein